MIGLPNVGETPLEKLRIDTAAATTTPAIVYAILFRLRGRSRDGG
jgi:hypothetical protein